MNIRPQMNTSIFGLAVGASLACFLNVSPSAVFADQPKKEQASIVGAELSTIANQLSMRPKTALDFSKVSGQYCYFMGWDKHHTHYAIDPSKGPEDMIDFVDARPLLKIGVNLQAVPLFPGKPGDMSPGQWYFLPAGKRDPYHGKAWDFPLLLRSTDIE